MRDVIKPNDKFNFMVCDDSANKGVVRGEKAFTNTGTFVVKNNEWGREFMEHWWEHPDGKEKELYHEQDILNGLIAGNVMGAKTNVKILDAEVMNSIHANLRKKPDTFVVHMMKKPALDRARRFRVIMDREMKAFDKAMPGQQLLVDLPDRYHYATTKNTGNTEYLNTEPWNTFGTWMAVLFLIFLLGGWYYSTYIYYPRKNMSRMGTVL
jgi:hypothetical protein